MSLQPWSVVECNSGLCATDATVANNLGLLSFRRDRATFRKQIIDLLASAYDIMSGKVALQVDVGAVGTQAIGVLTTFSSALTADNRAPMILGQIGQLKSLFQFNGSISHGVPDLLPRCESFRLEKLALSVGWRRIDAPSILSNIASGPVVALLIACLGF